jgi:hypothetical protein
MKWDKKSKLTNYFKNFSSLSKINKEYYLMNLPNRKKMIFINKNLKNKKNYLNKKKNRLKKMIEIQWTVLIILLGAIKVRKL